LPAPGVSVEAVLAAKPDAIIAGADRAVRPAWLDEWKRWPTLPAVARGNLFTVDANLLHRSGPRFIDGVEALCGTLSEARAAAR
jgi:iron complex transport system substrate-binding protein